MKGSRPSTRTDDLVVQDSGIELLIYDLKRNQAYCLNETAALVWQLCDGKNTVSEISDKMSQQAKTTVSEDLVWLALDQFGNDGLLDDNILAFTHFEGTSRREILSRIVLVSTISLPIISSIIAPEAIKAQSGGCHPSGTCIGSGQNLCPPGCTDAAIAVNLHTTRDGSCGPGTAGDTLNCSGGGPVVEPLDLFIL